MPKDSSNESAAPPAGLRWALHLMQGSFSVGRGWGLPLPLAHPLPVPPSPQQASVSAPTQPSTPQRASGRACWAPAGPGPPCPFPRASLPPTLQGECGGWGARTPGSHSGQASGRGGAPSFQQHRDARAQSCSSWKGPHPDLWHLTPVSPARTFNDESPLGLRRILSQSTDSLNARNRTLSVESLIDEGIFGDTSGQLVQTPCPLGSWEQVESQELGHVPL